MRAIPGLQEANEFLREHYIADPALRDSDSRSRPSSAAVPLRPGQPGRNLHPIFAIQQERVVNRDNTVQIGPGLPGPRRDGGSHWLAAA